MFVQNHIITHILVFYLFYFGDCFWFEASFSLKAKNDEVLKVNLVPLAEIRLQFIFVNLNY